jgi:putative toxin-antitoxin system antitoxin component (TIGR02293 family)
MTSTAWAEMMGGARILRSEVRSELDMADAVHAGLPMRVADTVVRNGVLTSAELHRLVIPRRTLAHRRGKGQRLTPEQSDRLARVVRVVARASEALGDETRAGHWLRAPNRALEGRPPLDLLGTDVGTRMVERILVRLEHGVVS